MPGARRDNRSSCPLNVSLEIFGDRWTLLIVRDLMLKGGSSFRHFLDGGENIATNILAVRLKKLEENSIIEKLDNELDARSYRYRLTEKGVDLAPILVEMIAWAARYEETSAPASEVRLIIENRENYIEEIRSRWRRK